MSKKSIQTEVVAESAVVETVATVATAVVETPTVETVAELKQLGRKVNPNSVRQQKLAKIEELKAQGVEIKRGRNANPESKNQQKQMRFEALRAQGFEVKRGRPKTKVTEVINADMLEMVIAD
jgi:biotin operon repressor